jgi:hypothetical protein
MTKHPRPTVGIWQLLQEATSEAVGRGHDHVGVEHLLYVLATTPDTFGRSFLEHVGAADAVAKELDDLMKSETYPGGSNEAWQDGELVGHVVVGPDGKLRLERLPGK